MTIRESRKIEDLAEQFLFPTDNTPSPIGNLCRKGKTIFYAFLDESYFEGATATEVALKLAAHSINL
jgi:hypothetical protein